jgi:hypothetical protein
MGWLKPGGWLTYFSVDAPGSTVVYDMTVTSAGAIRLAAMGLGPNAFADAGALAGDPGWQGKVAGLGALAGLMALAALAARRRRPLAWSKLTQLT